jgi:YafQ family addiction module toxin component
MYQIDVKPKVEKIFDRLRKRNPRQMQILHKKMEEIVQDPNRYKNLREPLADCKRVHIDKSFVLVFSVDEARKTVILEKYGHHDDIYDD